MSRRTVHIHVRLPDLTPRQAVLLWTFLENLASQIWEVYEPEILDQFLTADSCPSDPDDAIPDHDPPPTSARPSSPTDSESEHAAVIRRER